MTTIMTREEAEEEFETFIDGNSQVDMVGLSYSPSVILREFPTNYEEAFVEWLNFEEIELLEHQPINKVMEHLGKIMLEEIGEERCMKSYETTDPYWVGRGALSYGDIRMDGELN